MIFSLDSAIQKKRIDIMRKSKTDRMIKTRRRRRRGRKRIGEVIYQSSFPFPQKNFLTDG